MSKIILYIATSQDGFIADKNGNVDWLPHPKNDHDLEIVGYTTLMKRIDTIVMGSKSFKQIVGFGGWGWPDKHTYVFSFELLQTPQPCITITNETPREFVNRIKHQNSSKDIWLLGGAELARSFAKDGLIDEIILTITPVVLRDGILLELPFNDFILKNEKILMDGIIQKTYLKK